MMQKTVIGIFSDREDAEDAIATLKQEEYAPQDISIIMRDAEESEELADSTGTNVLGGAATGATTGAVIGGIAGLLIGVGAIAIPGFGALLIGGPLAAALGLTGAAATTVSGAATGALAGGLLGALMGIGVPEEDARVYEDRIKKGGILVAVLARPGEEAEVEDILDDTGADTIRSLTLRSSIRSDDYTESDEEVVEDEFDGYGRDRGTDYRHEPVMSTSGRKGGKVTAKRHPKKKTRAR